MRVRFAGAQPVGEMATRIDPMARPQFRHCPRNGYRQSEADFHPVANANHLFRITSPKKCGVPPSTTDCEGPGACTEYPVVSASSREGLRRRKRWEILFGDQPIEVKIWTNGIFLPGVTNVEALEAELK